MLRASVELMFTTYHPPSMVLWCSVPSDWVCTGQQEVCNAVSASSTHSSFSLSNICLDNTVAPSKSAHKRKRPARQMRHDVTRQFMRACMLNLCILLLHPTKHKDGLRRSYVILVHICVSWDTMHICIITWVCRRATQ